MFRGPHLGRGWSEPHIDQPDRRRFPPFQRLESLSISLAFYTARKYASVDAAGLQGRGLKVDAGGIVPAFVDIA